VQLLYELFTVLQTNTCQSTVDYNSANSKWFWWSFITNECIIIIIIIIRSRPQTTPQKSCHKNTHQQCSRNLQVLDCLCGCQWWSFCKGPFPSLNPHISTKNSWFQVHVLKSETTNLTLKVCKIKCFHRWHSWNVVMQQQSSYNRICGFLTCKTWNLVDYGNRLLYNNESPREELMTLTNCGKVRWMWQQYVMMPLISANHFSSYLWSLHSRSWFAPEHRWFGLQKLLVLVLFVCNIFAIAYATCSVESLKKIVISDPYFCYQIYRVSHNKCPKLWN